MSSLERALESFLRENGVSGVGGERLSQLIGDLLEEGAETSTRAPLPRPEPKVGLDVYGRYVDRGLLGEGGMGQVRRVLDTELKRDVAMKILRRDLIYRPGIADRFVEEAQATAQLRHPGIIPVHEVGRLPDGRHYFTMDVVRGETLNKLIRAVHMCSDATGWGQTADGLTFRRLVTLFLRACQAVAYAHSRGVLHRDIKPQNVMVGEFGEVQVLDWGLAKVGNEPDLDDAVETDRSVSGELNTQIGTVTGTPSYMAPEQARGQTHRLGPTSDVYSLGAMLYQVLSGRPPYLSGDTPIVSQVVTGPPPALSTLEGPPIPADLHDICVKAMSRLPEERYPDARALAVALQAWLDGLEKVEQAMALIDEAEAAGPSAQAKRAEAMDLRARADAALTGVPAWAPEEDKRDAWSLEQDAEQLEWAAEVEELEVNNVLHTALRVAPSLWPAHLLLAERYRHEHAAAEAIRDRAAAAKAEISLRHHVAALPAGGEDRERLEAWLRGDGQLTVETERPCRARLHRYRTVDRRLVTESLYGLGMTPVIALTLPMGSYLLELETPEGERVRYPFSLGRQEHWCPPRPVPVPSGLEPHEIYVPEGWFSSGGDAEALDPLPGRRLWCHGFVMRRDPITHAEFIAFLDALAARGEGALAERLAPRQPAGSSVQRRMAAQTTAAST
jgi:serine/threonine-protein kinase